MLPERDLDFPLPGELSREEEVARIIRVDHAGETGAEVIYRGQLAVLGKSPVAEKIRHMHEQEKVHLRKFEELLAERRVRPSLLMPLWKTAGFALGAASALLGEKAAMACTVAVEEVIDGHYRKQEELLGTHEPDLKEVISRFRAEELEHRDTGLEAGAEEMKFYRLFSLFVKTSSRAAIWVAERV